MSQTCDELKEKYLGHKSDYPQIKELNRLRVTGIIASTLDKMKLLKFVGFNPFITRVIVSTKASAISPQALAGFNPFITRVIVSTEEDEESDDEDEELQSLYNQGNRFNS